jgi:hypothetical protein
MNMSEFYELINHYDSTMRSPLWATYSVIYSARGGLEGVDLTADNYQMLQQAFTNHWVATCGTEGDYFHDEHGDVNKVFCALANKLKYDSGFKAWRLPLLPKDVLGEPRRELLMCPFSIMMPGLATYHSDYTLQLLSYPYKGFQSLMLVQHDGVYYPYCAEDLFTNIMRKRRVVYLFDRDVGMSMPDFCRFVELLPQDKREELYAMLYADARRCTVFHSHRILSALNYISDEVILHWETGKPVDPVIMTKVVRDTAEKLKGLPMYNLKLGLLSTLDGYDNLGALLDFFSDAIYKDVPMPDLCTGEAFVAIKYALTALMEAQTYAKWLEPLLAAPAAMDIELVSPPYTPDSTPTLWSSPSRTPSPPPAASDNESAGDMSPGRGQWMA